MRKITHILLAFAFALFGMEGYSQNVGIKGGLNMSKILQQDADDVYSDEFQFHPGFHVGIVVEFPINDIIAIQSGLTFNTRGVEYEADEDFPFFAPGTTTTMNLYYIDLPVLLKAETDVSDMLTVYGMAGPYVGYGFSGEISLEPEDGEEQSNDISWGDDPLEDDLMPLDYGVTVAAGVEVSSFMFEVAYDVGWANISPTTENDSVQRNRLFRVSVGYFFVGTP